VADGPGGAQAILAELPLANVDGNEHNRHRLDFGQVVPRPVRARAPQPARRTTAPSRRRDGLSRRQRHAIGALFAWGVLSVVLWLGGLRLGLHGTTAALDAAVGAASLLLAAWGYTRPRRQRFWALLANAAALAGGVYLVWAVVLAPHWAAWTATTR
jgi:TRAP-type C4-dicarboxylate transport system permease large subunit